MKELTKELRERLLNLFRYSDQDRPMLLHTMRIEWLGETYLCTSNAHDAVFIKDKGDIPIDEEVKTVNIRGILPDELYKEASLLSDFLSIIQNPPMVTRKVRYDCEACGGVGEFEHYGEKYKCKTCDEVGYLEGNVMETIPDPKCYLKIIEQYLAMDRWKELKSSVHLLEGMAPSLLKAYNAPHKLFFGFDVGEIIILLMASINLDEKKNKVVDLGYGKEVSNG